MMTNGYLIGMLAAFVEPALHAWSNVLDNRLSNHFFQRLTPLLFLSSAVGLLIIPLLWVLDPPTLVSFKAGILLLVISLSEVAYLYPYYWSLRHADTSVVASLFSLGTGIVPLFAYFLAGERLNGSQYLGFFILIATSVLLTLDRQRMRLNRAFALMLLVAIILAIQSVLLKYVFVQGVSWGTSVAWMIGFQFLITSLLMCWPQNISAVRSTIRRPKSVPLFIAVELLGWGGNLGSSYALYLIPVSVARGISTTQPLFVLLYAILFEKTWPDLFNEHLEEHNTRRRVALFAITIVSVMLISFA